MEAAPPPITVRSPGVREDIITDNNRAGKGKTNADTSISVIPPAVPKDATSPLDHHASPGAKGLLATAETALVPGGAVAREEVAFIPCTERIIE